ncbi:hypothetical protein DSO57_1007361 [Entomophthora muscae]|uniref:Uncharacterized protein n=1 Tax=Entomophthora muscae TaxID=34485 RepID=A0ACC2RYL4_9FUNG|nr:hypothetical protein DSO57_1007361 [Entomophthora muscae]
MESVIESKFNMALAVFAQGKPRISGKAKFDKEDTLMSKWLLPTLTPRFPSILVTLVCDLLARVTQAEGPSWSPNCWAKELLIKFPMAPVSNKAFTSCKVLAEPSLTGNRA